DPVPRRTAAGDLVFPGHIGTIYQASDAEYLGRTTPRRVLLLPNGRVLSERALSKVCATSRATPTLSASWCGSVGCAASAGGDRVGGGGVSKGGDCVKGAI